MSQPVMRGLPCGSRCRQRHRVIFIDDCVHPKENTEMIENYLMRAYYWLKRHPRTIRALLWLTAPVWMVPAMMWMVADIVFGDRCPILTLDGPKSKYRCLLCGEKVVDYWELIHETPRAQQLCEGCEGDGYLVDPVE